MVAATLSPPYAEMVEALCRRYAGYRPATGDIAHELVIDLETGHFEVIAMGWEGRVRVHFPVIHIDVIGDKVWIQHNATSELIGEELVEMGVPRDHIVLGFQPPDIRPLTKFGVG